MQGTIQYVNDPKNPAGKYGNVKLSDGTFIFVPVNMMSLFRGTEGKFAEIPTKSQTWGQGDEAKPVMIATAGPKPAANGGAAAGWTGAQRSQPAAQAGYTSYTPKTAAPKDDKEARQIFVTGVVGRAMGSGKFVPSEIPVLAQADCDAYDQHLGPAKPKPAAPPPPAVEGSDFHNDDIPDHMLEPDGR